MGNKVTTKEHLGQLFQAWNNTYLGWIVQQSGKFTSYMEWAKFLSSEPNTYICEHGLFEIIPEGKRLAKLPVYPFCLGDFAYNAKRINWKMLQRLFLVMDLKRFW